MTFEFNLYRILGVDVNVSSEDLKKAYRKLSKKWHPDNPDTGDVELFKKINLAYSILNDTERRKLYDFGMWDKLDPESEINLSEAEQNILALFEKHLEYILPYNHTDKFHLKPMMEDISQKIANEIINFKHLKLSLDKDIEDLKKLKSHIDFKKNSTQYNLLEMAITQGLSNKDSEIEDIQIQEKLSEEMLLILEDFQEFIKKKRPMCFPAKVRGVLPFE